MPKIDNMVQNFLAQKKITVVGVSNKRETGCNLSYKKFKNNGCRVYAVNPRISNYDAGLAASMTSVSSDAVEKRRANGIAVIPGSCPNQFLQPNFGHATMRGLWRLFGFMGVN